MQARVHHVERLGELTHVYLGAPAAMLLAKTSRDDVAVGDVLAFEIPAQAMHVFRADGVALARP
jgi:multiple sugar transport system ATP-binding protein